MTDRPPPARTLTERLAGYSQRFERLVILALAGMMALLVVVSTVELGWILFRDLSTPPVLLLQVGELLDVFGFFLLVLIGLELLETIRAYLRTNVIPLKVILEVALIAVARKAILLDFEKDGYIAPLSLAALILALAVAFHVTRKVRGRAAASKRAAPER